MAYTWKGMRVLTLDEVDELYRKDSLAGYYLLYPDNTESMIDEINLKEIIDHVSNGVKFGEELPTSELTLPDGKVILAPDVIDLTELSEFDELEYSLWHTIEEYLVYFGIRTLDDQPDWATVKGVQEKLFEILESSGVIFKS